MADEKAAKKAMQREKGTHKKNSEKYLENKPDRCEEANDQEDNIEDDKQNFKGRIDVHTLNYFKRVEKLLEDDSFEDAESKELFLNNVLDQTGEGPRTCQLAKHRLTSKILETLIGMCNSRQFLSLLKSLVDGALLVSSDRFGSHVIEKAVSMVPVHLNCKMDDVTTEIEQVFCNFVKVIKKNVAELMRDTYSSHIVSTVIQVLSGICVADAVSRSRNSRITRGKFFKGAGSKRVGQSNFGKLFEKSTNPTPEIFKKHLKKIAKSICKDDNFGELLCHKSGSTVIQTLLLALKEKDQTMCSRVCNMVVERSKLLEWGRANEENTSASVPILFADEVGSHVMEKIFHAATSDLYEVLFSKCFQNHLLQFALHPLANYILQHMMTSIPTVEMASETIQELFPFTEDILASGNMGVVVRMVELSNQFQCKQKELLKALMKAVHLPSEKEKQSVFLKLLLTLSTYDIMFENCIEENVKDTPEDMEKKLDKQVLPGTLTKETLNYHGACLVRTLFCFENPKVLLKGLMKMEEDLLFISTHDYGSFVIEQFLTSETVKKTYKKRFLQKVKELLITLAMDKFGSRVVDKLWVIGDEEEKKIIKEELYRSRSRLKGNMYGRIILRNCGIESTQFQARNDDSKTEQFSTGSSATKSKKRIKEKPTDSSLDEVLVREKKIRKIDSSIDEVFQKLGAGMDSDGTAVIEELESEAKNEMTNSNEIDELFAKVKVAQKKKTKRTKS
ncbi:uncharacterized protein LOC135691299 [Rhopilema esculentum]|uniref:uncharacterized protein LOC135691299 n=1 Tax=Rhopilema esculentum TaxID=499914 RepID=UPI0031DD7043